MIWTPYNQLWTQRLNHSPLQFSSNFYDKTEANNGNAHTCADKHRQTDRQILTRRPVKGSNKSSTEDCDDASVTYISTHLSTNYNISAKKP